MRLRSIDEAKLDVRDWVTGVVFDSGLTPKQVPKAWVDGLRSAGIDAKVAKMFRNGNWTTLPLVIDLPCPREHVDDSRERFARVRLRVEPSTGWFTIHEDSCSRCPQRQIEVWLLTCPPCVAYDDSHPEHEVFEVEDDESPIALVLTAMSQALFEGPKTKAKSPTGTRAKAVEWLDGLKADDGSLVVPTTMGQTAAWDLVRGLPGHPPQVLVREAQAERKGRASSPA